MITVFEEWFGWLVVFIIIGAGCLIYYKKSSGQKQTSPQQIASFTRDLTALAREGKLDPVTERDEELDRVIRILLRRTKNNPLLVGEPGVGKTAIAEGLAQKIVNGSVPPELKEVQILSLDVAALLSQTAYRGELEKRLCDLFAEIEAKPRSICLFIDEVHLLAALGRSEGAVGIVDIIKPALSRGSIQVIGATTWKEYVQYIRVDQPLDRRFQPVLVDEPTPEATLHILKTLQTEYETFHGVKFTEAALTAAIDLSQRYMQDRFLPDKAIDLIDEAATKVAIESRQVHLVPLGVLNGAMQHKVAQGKDETMGSVVDVDDIQTVIEQWKIHHDQIKQL